MSNEFEKYPVLTEHIREYASFGHFSNWSSFLTELNQILSKANPPPPASAVEEAERMYPYPKILTVADWRVDEVIDRERSAHIACAGMYTGEIERLKNLVHDAWYDGFGCDPIQLTNTEMHNQWEKFKAKHNL